MNVDSSDSSKEILNQVLRLDFPLNHYADTELHSCFHSISTHTLPLVIKSYSDTSVACRIDPKYQICLGMWTLSFADYVSTNVTSHFSCIVKAKSRRYDMSMSVYDYWQRYKNEIVQLSVDTFQFYNKCPLQTSEQLQRECIEKLNRIPAPAFYPVCIVSQAIRYFRVQKMLDISAGYGDRLIAALAHGCEYWSCDPNSELQSSYQAIKAYFRTEKQDSDRDPNRDLQQVCCSGYELEFPEPHHRDFDFLFSSPPFFDLEIYQEGSETNQSINRYPDIDRWLDRFLFQSLRKSDRYLKSGAHIVIHMVDIIPIRNSNTTFSQQNKKRKWTEKEQLIGSKSHKSLDGVKISLVDEENQEKHEIQRKCFEFLEKSKERMKVDLSQKARPPIRIVQPLLDFCTVKLKWKYLGMLSYGKSNGVSHGPMRVQPLWVFQKP